MLCKYVAMATGTTVRVVKSTLMSLFAQAQVQKLEAHVKKQEVYHTELQEVERWLLQMSSRMVTPDPTPGGGLEAAAQQLARHKVIGYSHTDAKMDTHTSIHVHTVGGTVELHHSLCISLFLCLSI